MTKTSNQSALFFVLVIAIFLLLSASQSVQAQESLSIQIPKQQDKVTVENEAYGQKGTYNYFVRVQKDSNARNASFNKDLEIRGINGKVVSCFKLIDIPAGQNHSYGGLCKLEIAEKQADVFICNSDMVSNFAIYWWNFTIHNPPMDSYDLVRFIVSNCMGG